MGFFSDLVHGNFKKILHDAVKDAPRYIGAITGGSSHSSSSNSNTSVATPSIVPDYNPVTGMNEVNDTTFKDFFPVLLLSVLGYLIYKG